MSMQTITYQGYGIDLGEYQNENKDLQNAMTAIINNDETAEWSFNDLNNKDASVTTPNLSDTWQCLIYIPAIIPVSLNEESVKIYSPTEAQSIFVKLIKEMFLKEKIPSDIWSGHSPAEKLKLMNEFYQSVEDFVKTHADYSYNRDWSDEV